MNVTQNNRQRERQSDRDEEEEEKATERQMYVTQNNRQREIVRQRGGGGGGGGGGYRQIDVCSIELQIERVSQIESRRRRRRLQIDLCNIEQQIKREIIRQRGGERGEGSYRQMYVTQNNRQRERQLDSEQEEEEATERQMYETQNNSLREIVRQRGGRGGGCYRYKDVCSIEKQIERDSQIENRRRRRRLQIDICNIEQ